MIMIFWAKDLIYAFEVESNNPQATQTKGHIIPSHQFRAVAHPKIRNLLFATRDIIDESFQPWMIVSEIGMYQFVMKQLTYIHSCSDR